MSRTLAAAAAALLLLLTGCSSDDSGSDDSSDSSSSSSGSSGSSDSSASADSADSDVHQVSGAGLTFVVPDNLEEIGADEVADDTEGDDKVALVAAEMGMTAEQFNQYMKQVDLFLFDKDSEGDFTTNVNVIPFPVSLPPQRELEKQLQQVGAEIGDTQQVETDAGDVTTISYSLEMAGTAIEGQGIYVDLGSEAASITVSSADRDTADEIADGIVGSLATE